jgi:hypothetical protein
LIGYDSRPKLNSGSNEIVIGNSTIGNGSNTVTIGTSSNSKTYLTGDLSLTGTITSGTWSASTIEIANGGTGATSAAAARSNLGLVIGTNVQAPLTAGSGISIASGTISATGLTTSNLASNAAITNAQLSNSSTVLGSTTMTLGGTVTSVTGLSSVTSTGFTGALTGNATTATTAGNITATTNSTLTSMPNLSTVGTITSGTWSGTTIAIANGGTGSTTQNFVDLTTAQTIAGSKTFTSAILGDLTGTATTATYAYQSGYAITSGLATTASNINLVNVSSGTFYPILSNTASSRDVTDNAICQSIRKRVIEMFELGISDIWMKAS